MTDNQSPYARFLRDAPNDLRRCVQRILCARGDREMHDQNVGSLGKLYKPWIGSVLIRAEHDGLVS